MSTAEMLFEGLLHEVDRAAHESSARTAAIVLEGFPFNSSALTAHNHARILRLARLIVQSWRTAQPIRHIVLTGYTDASGAAAYNRSLGLRRAQTVRTALLRAIQRMSRGVTKVVRVAVRSAGAARPVASNVTPEGRARNRRVEARLSRVAPRMPVVIPLDTLRRAAHVLGLRPSDVALRNVQEGRVAALTGTPPALVRTAALRVKSAAGPNQPPKQSCKACGDACVMLPRALSFNQYRPCLCVVVVDLFGVQVPTPFVYVCWQFMHP